MSAPDRYEFVRDVMAPRHRGLLETNTYQSCAEFCRHVCEELAKQHPADQWGMLSKTAGELGGWTWPNGQRTSHDVICIPAGDRIDILANASANEPGPQPKGPASVIWLVIPRNHWRPENVWIPYTAVGGTPPPPDPDKPAPPPPPPPTPGCPDPSAHLPLPPVDPLRYMSDDDKLAIAAEFHLRGRTDDTGGIVDAGTQFASRIQARYSREQALQATREWIVFWYGPKP
jgi:hypothetical protein